MEKLKLLFKTNFSRLLDDLSVFFPISLGYMFPSHQKSQALDSEVCAVSGQCREFMLIRRANCRSFILERYLWMSLDAKLAACWRFQNLDTPEVLRNQQKAFFSLGFVTCAPLGKCKQDLGALSKSCLHTQLSFTIYIWST